MCAATCALGAAACRTATVGGTSQPARQSAAAPGSTSSTAAVEAFLAAAQANDSRAMAALFGTRAGSVMLRDPAADVEKRMIALACYLSHDATHVLGDVPGLAEAGDRTITVELRQRELVRQTRFTAVPGPGGRWYVQAFDIEPVSDFCRPH